MLAKLPSWYRSTFGPALLGALALWAALPPLELGPLAWIAPVAWVILIRRKQLAGRRPYRTLWLVGFLFWMAVLHFLRLPHWATSFGWVALSFYLAFYLPVFVGLSRVAVHRLRVPAMVAAPVVWTGLELARGHLLTGLTMASLGHTQYRWIGLIQISDLAGAYGVSFLVMLVAACLATMLPRDDRPSSPLKTGATAGLSSSVSHKRRQNTAGQASSGTQSSGNGLFQRVARQFWPLLPALIALGLTLIYGHVRTSGDYGGATARVALIQGSIDSELKADPNRRTEIFQQYFELSKQAVRDYPNLDLAIWPETMFRDPLVTFDQNARPPEQSNWSPDEFRESLDLAAQQSRRNLGRTAEALGVSLILGVDTANYTAAGPEYFNSAVLVSADGRLLGRYDKIHLVLFGEYVPFARRFPWLYRFTPLSVGLTPGRDPTALDTAGLMFAPNICYESVLPHVIRRQVNELARRQQDPDVLVNLTNDGWFWGSSELDLHLICGVFRAVECRKPLLIAANTGFSAWIDADGRIRARGPRRQTGTILAEVQADRRTSWYLYHGDWPAGICLAACLLLAAAGCWHGIRRTRA